MLGENKNLKDTKDSLKDTSMFTRMPSDNSQQQVTDTRAVSHQAKNLNLDRMGKLISALYMVTDIIDEQEPIRLKLRTLGANILSDIHSIQQDRTGKIQDMIFQNHRENRAANQVSLIHGKIQEVLSFLNIASTIGLISAMNSNIIKNEFLKLKETLSVEESPIWLEEFLTDIPTQEIPKGHTNPIRLGVQKGSTLMKAISDSHSLQVKKEVKVSDNNFELLKKKRREEITKIVKDKQAHSNPDGATITDIRAGAKGVLVSCGEKTLQRELVSMVSDGVLKKSGEKRWSKYFI